MTKDDKTLINALKKRINILEKLNEVYTKRLAYTETTLNEAQIQNLKVVLQNWEAHMINPELVIRCVIRAVE
jgi:hypothetical protein